MKTENTAGNKPLYAVMFGYRGKDDMDTTGYLKTSGRGYEITPEAGSASRFVYARPKGAKGWAPPRKWLKFFNSEEELSPWVFHLVNVYAAS